MGSSDQLEILLMTKKTITAERIESRRRDDDMADKGLFCGVNKPKDPGNLSELEGKHVPEIVAPDIVKAGEPFKVTVRVGRKLHVMEEGHHIQWLELYSRGNYLTRVDFSPVFTKPEATFTLVKGGVHGSTVLRATARCNLHGLWEGEKRISVEK